MRKKFLLLWSLLGILVLITACGSNKETVKEYNIDDFLKSYNKVVNSVEEKTKYWSDSEREESKYTDVIKQYAEKNDLSINQTIQLRGKFAYILGTALNLQEEENSENSFLCFFHASKKSTKVPSEIALLNPGDNIKVEVTIFPKYNENGKSQASIYSDNCKVITPNLSKVKYKSNTNSVIGDSTTSRIMGEVTSVIENPYYEAERKEISDSVDSSVSGEYEFSSALQYATNIVSLNLDGTDDKLLCFVNKSYAKLPKTGDKISLIGSPFTYSNTFGVDANYSPIYIFK